MSQWTLVVPAASARRALQFRLAERAKGLVLVPPRIITPGQLPELLYTPTQPVADPLMSLLTRMCALRQAPAELLNHVMLTQPQADDWRGWMTLAEDLQQLQDMLAAEGWQVSEVGPKLAQTSSDFVEGDRWEALSSLQDSYQSQLSRQGLVDLQSARLKAMGSADCRLEGQLALVAVTDLGQMLRQMLTPVAAQVQVMIHAPESEAAMFDDWGALHVSSWMERPIGLSQEQIHVVDRPGDQARCVLKILAQIQQEQKGLLTHTHQVTIGLGDATLAEPIERVMEEAGLPARPAQGLLMRGTRPVLLLQHWAALLASSQWDDIAALLRHPDMESYLAKVLGTDQAQSGTRHWQTLLDEYLQDHLQGKISAQWLGEEKNTAPLRKVYQAVAELGPVDAHTQKPLPDWCPAISAMLLKVYGVNPINRTVAADDALYHALQQLAQVLEAITLLPPAPPPSPPPPPEIPPPTASNSSSDSASPGSVTPVMTLTQAIGFVLAQVSMLEIPRMVEPGAVELLGWLELPLDEAPVLVITGFNEGNIPDSRSPDAFLPDRVRRTLGLFDNQRRYARDAAYLTAMLQGRKAFHVITGRRGSEDDPLLPSRLLLACPPDRLAKRVLQFYDQQAGGDEPAPGKSQKQGAVTQGPAMHTAARDRFLLPLPVPPAEPITRLRVTAFRDYLQCPYRFYLKHVLKLRAVEQVRPEMDALHFGSLAHSVLESFGRSPVRDASDPDEIRHYLWKHLEKLVAEHYGDSPAPAVVMQTLQLKERLSAFAWWQAEQIGEGWRILAQDVERDLSAKIRVDGESFTLTGRIDRMDHHPVLGKYRLLDYKTGDSAQKPQKTHRYKGRWVDLQLPLYRMLVMEKNWTEPEVGYILLPKKLSEVGLAPADWSGEEFDEAMETAGEVIRRVRAGEFWPPSEPVDDELAALCMDEALDRMERIKLSQVDGGRFV